MYDNSIIVAPKDGKFTIETNCLGFGLEPMPGNRGKYPVTAIVNGNTTRPLTIEDGHIYTQETRIRRIEVVDLTAGWDADRWRITLKNECGDSREVRHPTNNRGELIAARPGASTLFVIDSRIAGPQFLENLQEFEGGDGILRLMVTPDQSLATQLQLWTTTPDIGSSAPGEAAYYAGWDVGDASQVLFGVDVWCSQVGRFPGTVKGYLHGAGSEYGLPLFTTPMGTLNEYTGTLGAKSYAAVMGAKADVANTQSTFDTRRAPFAVFTLEFSGFTPETFEAAFADPRKFWLRISAVAF